MANNNGPQLVLIWPVGGDGSNIPSFGGGWGSGPRPDQGLPGGQPHPDQGLPGGGYGGHPSQPIHIPGLPHVPDQGLPPGQPITPNPPLPPPSGENANKTIVAVWHQGAWTVTAYDLSNRPDQGLPPTPQPHRGR